MSWFYQPILAAKLLQVDDGSINGSASITEADDTVSSTATLTGPAWTGWKTAGTASAAALSGSGDTWAGTGNTTSSNSSFATSNLSDDEWSDWLRLTNFGFTTDDIPDGATITGIEFRIERMQEDSNNIQDYHIYARNGSGQTGSDQKATGVNWPVDPSKAYRTYGGTGDLLGATWADSDIRASTFGLDIAIFKNGTAGTSRLGSIDHVEIRVEYEVAASSRTATASITEANDTIAATGTLPIVGTSAPTEAGDTLSSTGTLPIAGVLAATEGDDSLSAVIQPTPIDGTAAITEEGDTVSATGELPIAAALAKTEDDDTVSASSTVSISGTAAITEGDDIGLSIGVLPIEAQTNGQEGDDTIASTGAITISGAASLPEADDTLAVVATLAVTGFLAASEADDTVSSTGELPIAASVAATEGDDTLAAAGVLSQEGSGQATITEDDDSLSATATIAISGQADITEDDDIGLSLGVLPIDAQSNGVEDDDALSATGELAPLALIEATATITEADDTVEATGLNSAEPIETGGGGDGGGRRHPAPPTFKREVPLTRRERRKKKREERRIAREAERLSLAHARAREEGLPPEALPEELTALPIDIEIPPSPEEIAKALAQRAEERRIAREAKKKEEYDRLVKDAQDEISHQREIMRLDQKDAEEQARIEAEDLNFRNQQAIIALLFVA